MSRLLQIIKTAVNQILQKLSKTTSLANWVKKLSNLPLKNVAELLSPDYAIYKSKQKSWEADLFVEGVPLAVKTQSAEAAKKYGLSWTFQAGSVRRDPILGKPEAWVCFVELVTFSSARVYPPYQIKDLKFREPRLEKLKGSKLVVYAEGLLDTVAILRT
jgi:hypothetical protein